MEVLLFGILGLFGVLGHTEIFGGDDADDETPGTPDETGGETLDTGASFVENADGSYDVELGDDETGSLAAIKFEQTSDGETYDQQFSLGLFLVPEGTEIPIDPTGEELLYDDIDSMVESLGLTEIASFEQGTLTNPYDGSEQEDTRVDPPVINSDDPIDIIRVRFDVGDGGEYFIRSEEDETLSAFEEPGRFFGAAEAVETTEDFTGTDAQDYVRAFGDDDTDPIAVDGGGGDDALFSNIAESSLHGGDGDDLLISITSGAQVSGGTGSDELIVGPNSMASGGAGNDNLTAVTATDGAYGYNGDVFDLSELPEDEEGTELHGHAGDDYLTASAASVSAHGGADNDTLVLSNGATGYGGKGDDFFNVAAGVTAKGGDGDDRFQMVETASDAAEAGTAVLSGGAGADTYEFNLFNAFSNDEAQFIRIKDFDPEEDILTIDGWGDNTTLQTVRVEEAENGNYSNVIAVFTQPTPDDETATVLATIRLDGVSGYSASELVATATS